MSTQLRSDTERRVLGHLVAWCPEEQRAGVEAHETAAGSRSIVSFSTAEMTQRLLDDPYSEVVESGHVNASLEGLVLRGLAEGDGEGWRMTAEGARALASPNEGTVEPGALSAEAVGAAVEFSNKLAAAGMVVGSHEFNKAGGISREGVKAWREAHGVGDPATLDALEAAAPPLAAVEEAQSDV